MRNIYVHLGMLALIAVGVIFDKIYKSVIQQFGSLGDPFPSITTGILLNLLFIACLVFLTRLSFLSAPNLIFSAVLVIIGVSYLVFAVPPLWFIPLTPSLTRMIGFPAMPLSYTGFAAAFLSVLGCVQLFRRKGVGQAL